MTHLPHNVRVKFYLHRLRSFFQPNAFVVLFLDPVLLSIDLPRQADALPQMVEQRQLDGDVRNICILWDRN